MSKELFNEFLKTVVGVLFRIAFTALGGWLASRGFATDADLTLITTGVIFIGVSFVWSLVQKYKVLELLGIALSEPATISIEEVKEKRS